MNGAVNGVVVGERGEAFAAPRRLFLPKREREVLDGMAEGLTNPMIAERLFLSVGTVRVYATRLFRRLGARVRAHAVHLAWRAGLLR